MLVDTHCHLDATEFDQDRGAVHAAARAAGVEVIVVPAVAAGNFAAVRACCRDYAGCYPAYGLHPLYVNSAGEGDMAVLRRWLEEEKPLAVGEIGLDFHVADIDPQQQERFFIEQLRLAREFDLPVLLHVRQAIDRVLYHLRRIPVRGGIAHAFNGSAQQAGEFIKLGFALGYGGAMSYPGSTRIRRLAAELPLESIVLETDAPDIPPVWLAGGRNSPAELPRLAATLATLRGRSVAEVIETTGGTARRLLLR